MVYIALSGKADYIAQRLGEFTFVNFVRRCGNLAHLYTARCFHYDAVVTFQIKPYLAAYMYMRYKNHLDVPPDRSSSSLSAIHLLDTQPIYHFLHQLSIPHPPNASWHETGNITFTLPHPRNGKNPNVYNYIGHNSALIIEKAMEVEMRAELYEFLLENKYCHGIMFKKSMETFVEHYNMVGLVEEESLMRAFQRWRKMMKEEKNR